jgi:transcriptional regulator with XRE-family HTH domain
VISHVPELIRDSRRAAGLTQAELARRLGTTQSGIARLERIGSNPTVETLDRALNATGHRLALSAKPAKSSVDETLVASQLLTTPTERLESFESAYAGARELALAGARARGELA